MATSNADCKPLGLPLGHIWRPWKAGSSLWTSPLWFCCQFGMKRSNSPNLKGLAQMVRQSV